MKKKKEKYLWNIETMSHFFSYLCYTRPFNGDHWSQLLACASLARLTQRYSALLSPSWYRFSFVIDLDNAPCVCLLIFTSKLKSVARGKEAALKALTEIKKPERHKKFYEISRKGKVSPLLEVSSIFKTTRLIAPPFNVISTFQHTFLRFFFTLSNFHFASVYVHHLTTNVQHAFFSLWEFKLCLSVTQQFGCWQYYIHDHYHTSIWSCARIFPLISCKSNATVAQNLWTRAKCW